MLEECLTKHNGTLGEQHQEKAEFLYQWIFHVLAFSFCLFHVNGKRYFGYNMSNEQNLEYESIAYIRVNMTKRLGSGNNPLECEGLKPTSVFKDHF